MTKAMATAGSSETRGRTSHEVGRCLVTMSGHSRPQESSNFRRGPECKEESVKAARLRERWASST
eukprot:CAMPEP_0195004030 /NCGR_PEP_ID=MMETSP0326_2-20130528/3924_1 /TAXON_ID=2866 ORGANISM="Crypthecodinium cohnii, Strain Seligo" /NCGR_SAMPLE_ID=MMETSP0326_2 /ASSEMBLY_ACC=CAM_ASM_000348 /LENGTH=64 /DNA_ID=CAMNT_0040008571 /DNA_START=591 /DNA_END=781 /DNA_ORIENTATION=+